ncbi:EscV/YscV/HrcV family type III secretion system export apparatus protein [Salmonella enterica subsp. enterica]|nr:EscV/YscV/HrcV family type III secretion system export apparatus protein [Salmonella enterica subsp. enterica serovar Bonn]EBZ5939318.1 EscV/YscV/HrcV family type III secretion system export apparatus protein [Salmonella enterica subsp. enterica serovar Muenchen]MLZ41061.1 EscV/YscV/HrcV family type III secretion system export apparatus protein [Salmonella enterica subsp. enterica serovar Bonn]
MNKLTPFLRMASGRQDIILASILLLAVFMIIIPLPTLLVDTLIALNLCVSLLLLTIAVYVREPLEFSSFPAVLLITTLFRLSLSISTTRLILLQHDAGEIVYTFGNFVVGGNLAIGLIIFSIITIVQFIVITKGSERVAEVSARFSLDGMPGKQMSIDGDMRAGTIDGTEARRLRSLVQKESQLYGAMDGAMKFVKGDAIAGMIIVIVNIIGGVCVGMSVHNMTASEALETYAILSIGDGLISQIPALLISITAGIIVTRVPGQERQNLATEMSEQFSRQPRPLFLAAGMLLLFAILPGFPTFVFLTLSFLLFIAGWVVIGKPTLFRSHGTKKVSKKQAKGVLIPGSVPLNVSVPSFIDPQKLTDNIAELRWRLFNELGLLIPEICHADNDNETCSLYIYQELVSSITLVQHGRYFNFPPKDHIEEYEQFSILPGIFVWCNQSTAQGDNTEGMSVEDYVISFIENGIRYHAKEFLGIQESKSLMDGMETSYPELVKEVQRQLPVGKIADVLQRLVEENVSVRDLRTIFETLVVWASKEKDPVVLTEYVRTGLRRHLLGKHCLNNTLHAWLIGDSIESEIRDSIRQTSVGSYSSLEPDRVRQIIQQIQDVVGSEHRGILLTAIDVRRYLRKMIEKHMYDISVLSFQEIGDSVSVNIIGNIEHDN